MKQEAQNIINENKEMYNEEVISQRTINHRL